MSRRFKITIAISGILIVALALLSFTYAYITTNITGNTNSKSITVSTRDTTIVYTNYDVTSDFSEIAPGTNTYMKFTVRNTGNKDVSYKIYLMDVYNDFSRKSDIKYILYGKAGNNTMDLEDLTDCSSNGCERITNGQFPATDELIRSGEFLTSGESYTYILKITYNTSSEGQTEDVGHKFSGRIQIFDNASTIDTVSPFNEGTLAEKIYRNAKNVTSSTATGTMYSAVPKTSPAAAISGSTEKTLSIAQDDYGASYYYRGNVVDNYLTFDNMCWRIVRIEGDGSIKITLESTSPCSAGMTRNFVIGTGTWGFKTLISKNSSNYYVGDYLNEVNNTSSMKYILENWTSNLGTNKKNLKSDEWCLGNSKNVYNSSGVLLSDSRNDLMYNGTTFYYEAGKRLNGYGETSNATLKCDGDKFNSSIGALTADEVVYAGGTAKTTENLNYYLINDYHKSNNFWWRTLTISYYSSNSDYAFNLSSKGNMVSYANVTYSGSSLRPAVTLKTDIMYRSGDGTIDNAYTVKES